VTAPVQARPCELLGVRVHTTTIPELNGAIAGAIASKKRCIIGCHNLHSIYMFHRDRRMDAFYELVDYIHIDGMALVGVARLLGYPTTRDHRVTWMDWLPPLMERAAKERWRVYYLGSAPGVAEKAAGILAERFPGLRMKTRHGYFDVRSDSVENMDVRKDINDYGPDLLMVGMGQPRQEIWVANNADFIHAHAIVTPGACMDYVAGLVRVPWRFMGRLGLEWVFRLVSEPRRLGRRYLIEPWSLAPLLISDVWGHWRGGRKRD